MAVNWDWALIWRGALNRHLIYGSQNDWLETYLRCRPMFCLHDLNLE